MPYRAPTDQTLLDCLEAMFRGRSRRDLRRLVADERVRVDGALATDLKARVARGSSVECAQFGKPLQLHPRVRLLFEDEHLLAVDKGAGILTTEGIRGGEPTVVDVLEKYLLARGIRRRVSACHRLDRDVSGVCLLAKDPRLAGRVRDDSRAYLLDRRYHALVEGVPAQPRGTIRSFLRDDDATKVVREAQHDDGKLSVTHWRVIEAGPGSAVLEIELETGRKNQIRVHLASIKHPVAGDAKYGARTDPAGRVALHAKSLTVRHPVTGEVLELRSPVPPTFARPPGARP